MTKYVWYIQAYHNPQATRGHRPENIELPEVGDRIRRIHGHARVGKTIDPAELPSRYIKHVTWSHKNMDVPMWFNSFNHVRDDMADVLRQFDLGETILKPITVVQGPRKGELTNFLTLVTSNIRPTIDPEGSEPLMMGAVRRLPLSTGKPTHPGVICYANADGQPDLWTDPEVDTTLFASDRLGLALKAQKWSGQLGLRRVRLGERPAPMGH